MEKRRKLKDFVGERELRRRVRRRVDDIMTHSDEHDLLGWSDCSLISDDDADVDDAPLREASPSAYFLHPPSDPAGLRTSHPSPSQQSVTSSDVNGIIPQESDVIYNPASLNDTNSSSYSLSSINSQSIPATRFLDLGPTRSGTFCEYSTSVEEDDDPENLDDSYCESDESEHSDLDESEYTSLMDFLSDDTSADQASDGSGPRTLRQDLAEWAAAGKIPRIQVTKLLHILHAHHPDLPLDSRTLLRTMRVVNSREVEPGRYYHFGLAKGLVKLLNCMDSVPERLSLHINFDGLPLTKSTNSQFWPVLCKAVEDSGSHVVTVGIYYGPRKADDANEVLRETVEEANLLYVNKLQYEGRDIDICICGLLADAPARANASCTVPHNSYYGCSKCTTKGTYVRAPNALGGRITFPELDASKRTDESFRLRSQPQHHQQKRSILESIPNFDMVKGIPVEGMHLLDIGVMKKILLWMMSGKTTPARQPRREMAMISNHLKYLKEFITHDFARDPRGLDELSRFKSTEFHFILHHAGPVIFKNVLPSNLYNNFLLLHVAVRLLSNKDLCRADGMIAYCESLLKRFVRECIELYGAHFITYNVHNLIHIPDDVSHFGPIYDFSCYPFENHLKSIKGLIVTYRNMLEQVVKRLDEIDKNTLPSQFTRQGEVVVSDIHSSGPMMHPLYGEQYQKLKTDRGFLITRSAPDNTVILNDTTAFCVDNILKTGNGEFLLLGRRYQSSADFFTFPLRSKKIGTILAGDLSNALDVVNVDQIRSKGCKIPVSNPENGYYVISPIPLYNRLL